MNIAEKGLRGRFMIIRSFVSKASFSHIVCCIHWLFLYPGPRSRWQGVLARKRVGGELNRPWDGPSTEAMEPAWNYAITPAGAVLPDSVKRRCLFTDRYSRYHRMHIFKTKIHHSFTINHCLKLAWLLIVICVVIILKQDAAAILSVQWWLLFSSFPVCSVNWNSLEMKFSCLYPL